MPEEQMLEQLKRANDLMQENNRLLKEMLNFWTHITSEEYFNEMVQKDGIKLPK